MARTLRNASIETRTARSKLPGRRKPFYCKIQDGLHLGYRKPKGRHGRNTPAGKWVLRHYVGGQAYQLEVIAEADDTSDADGRKILNFQQAQKRAREWQVEHSRGAVGEKGGPYTVNDAIDDYVEWLKSEGRLGCCRRTSLRPPSRWLCHV